MQTAMHVEQLSKSYGDLLAVDQLSLSIPSGTVFGLLGANGAGKSTAMECILGTKTADSGTVTILGHDPIRERKQLFQKVGVQFQPCDYQPEIRVSELCEEISCLYQHPSDWKVQIHGNCPAFLGSWLLTMLSSFSIGMMGSIAKNSKHASMIASALYFPMLLFSGATLPLETMPIWMQKIINVFPMAQGIQLMKATFLGLPVPNLWLPILVMTAVSIICIQIAVSFFKWE